MTRPITLALFGMLGLVAVPAHADTADATMDVSLVVTESCAVSAGSLNFTAQTDGANASDAEATIDLVCSPDTTYEVALGMGENSISQTRRLVDPETGAATSYQVYSDAGRTAVWGETSGVDTLGGTAGADGGAQLVAYGRVERDGSRLQAGNYSDSVIVTVNF